jgi:hypothetical protein
MADNEAKTAARGTTSNKKSLPPLLRRKLPANPAALKKNHIKSINVRWQEKWRKSPRGNNMLTIDDTTPSNNFLKLISNRKLTRKGSSTITQIITGHFPLNGYLHRFKLVDNPRCPACGAATETIHHFLLTCPTYAHERWPLTQVCKGAPTLKKLLSDNISTALLLKYIEATHRFDKQGEFTRPE